MPNLAQSRSVQARDKVGIKTTYALNAPAQAFPPRHVKPWTTPSLCSGRTRMYSTSSTATASPVKLSTPTSGCATSSTASSSPPTAIWHKSRVDRGPYVPHTDRKRRHEGVCASSAVPSPSTSPPRAYRRVDPVTCLPPLSSPLTSHPTSTSRCSFTAETRLPISSSQSSRPAAAIKSASRPAKPIISVTSTAPLVSTDSSRRSYRYPSLSQGTAATPQRNLNVGLLPIDTSLSSQKATAKNSTFLRESPTRLSKYPTKQREGLVVDGEKERAFSRWLRRNKDRTDLGAAAGKVGGLAGSAGVGMRELGDGRARDYERRLKRRGKGQAFWEWSPRA